jgi:hypothetical protein
MIGKTIAERFAQPQALVADQLPEGFALHVLHRDKGDLAGGVDVVNRDDK